MRVLYASVWGSSIMIPYKLLIRSGFCCGSSSCSLRKVKAGDSNSSTNRSSCTSLSTFIGIDPNFLRRMLECEYADVSKHKLTVATAL